MKKNLILLAAAALILLGGSSGWGNPVVKGHAPKILRTEHDQLHAGLEKCTQMKGETGKAAKKAQMLLRPHLFKEEDIVLPELGLLRQLIDDQVKDPGVITATMQLAEKLHDNYPLMVAEHKAILNALDELRGAAEKENNPEAAVIAMHFKAHIRDEDEVFYPAAILVGKYLQLKQSNAG